MTSSSKIAVHDSVDEARQQLCQRLADGLRGGAYSFQVRFQQPHGTPTEAWIYSHADNDWKKRDDLAISLSLVSALLEQLEMLVNRDFSDLWTLRRKEHSDRTEFELKFRHEAILPHVNAELESYLLGCLFHGHHDSGQDSRHRMGFRKS